MSTRTVAIVAPYFPPSNMASGHRARLWSRHLKEFGWTPLIVSTHWDYYEEPLDWDLCELVDPDVEIIRTRAWRTKPVRLIGDIGLRSLEAHRKVLNTLAAARRIDFVHVTIPSNFSAVLGRMVHDKYGVPYGIDYIDPWVHPWPGSEKVLSKAWVSLKLAEHLEPWAVKHASLITGVAAGYYQGVLERNPHLRETCHTAAMPYGNSPLDFETVRQSKRSATLFDPSDGCFHMVYAGALLPQAHVVLDRLLQAVALIKARDPQLAANLRLHFAGTGTSPTDPAGFNVKPMAEAVGIGGLVTETPNRIPFMDVLSNLQHASGILIVGSTEPHYTPSKVYQSVDARRPIFGLFHEDSTALEVVRSSNAGTAISLSAQHLPEPPEIADALTTFIRQNVYDPAKVDWQQFERYSARESARQLAAALDVATGDRP